MSCSEVSLPGCLHSRIKTFLDPRGDLTIAVAPHAPHQQLFHTSTPTKLKTSPSSQHDGLSTEPAKWYTIGGTEGREMRAKGGTIQFLEKVWYKNGHVGGHKFRDIEFGSLVKNVDK